MRKCDVYNKGGGDCMRDENEGWFPPSQIQVKHAAGILFCRI
jgi:hypothetical protein